jgi:hypothetical protein
MCGYLFLLICLLSVFFRRTDPLAPALVLVLLAPQPLLLQHQMLLARSLLCWSMNRLKSCLLVAMDVVLLRTSICNGG